MPPISSLKNMIAIGLVMSLLLTSCQGQATASQENTSNTNANAVTVAVKFNEGTDIRLRDGKLVSLSTGSLSSLDAALERYGVTAIERQFSQPEEQFAREQAEIEKETGQDIPDLNLYFRLRLRDAGQAQGLLTALAKLPVVETAYLEASPVPPPAENP